MTTRDLIHQADQHPIVLAAALVAVPVAAGVAGWLHERGQGGRSPWKYPLLKWGTYTLFRRRDEPTREPPKFPGV